MPLALAVLLVLIVLPAGAGAQVPEGARHQRATVVSSDGTRLAVDFFLPASLGEGERVPVVVDGGPYFGRFNQRDDAPVGPNRYVAHGLIARGYAIVDVSLRGYGGSGGCLSFHGEDDRRDMEAAVEWAADQTWSTGRVAVAGFSYDGGAALNAIAARPRGLAAAVLFAPVADPYESLWSDGIHHSAPLTANLFGPGLTALDAVGPAAGEPADRELENVAAVDPACWARHNQGVEQPDQAHPFWRERDPAGAVGRTDVPVITSFGFEDSAARIPDYLRALGGPLRAWLGQWGHLPANDEAVYPQYDAIGRDGFQAEIDAFLDHHLKGIGRPPRDGFVVQEGAGGFREEAAWPPADAEPLRLPVLAGSFRDAPGNTADRRGTATGTPGGVPSTGQGRGSWTFTPPLVDERHLAGAAVAAIDAGAVVPGAQAVALLYDVAPDGTATFVSRGAAPVAAGKPTRVRLLAQDWRFRPGHRIGLLVTGADDSFYRPGRTLQEVTIAGGELRLPVLRRSRSDDLDGGPNDFMAERRPFTVDAATIEARTTSSCRAACARRGRR